MKEQYNLQKMLTDFTVVFKLINH